MATQPIRVRPAAKLLATKYLGSLQNREHGGFHFSFLPRRFPALTHARASFPSILLANILIKKENPCLSRPPTRREGWGRAYKAAEINEAGVRADTCLMQRQATHTHHISLADRLSQRSCTPCTLDLAELFLLLPFAHFIRLTASK